MAPSSRSRGGFEPIATDGSGPSTTAATRGGADKQSSRAEAAAANLGDETVSLLSSDDDDDDQDDFAKDDPLAPNGAANGRPRVDDEATLKMAAEREHSLTPREAVRAYPMAIFWSLAVSTCVIMEGYDTILIGAFFAYPAFAARYGQFVDENGHHQLSALWQAVLGNSTGLGCFVGVLLNGWLVSRFGQKRSILAALAVLSGTVTLTFTAPSIGVLALGEFLCGLPWGVFASGAPAYASEVLPLPLRPYFTSYINMCFIIGQLIAALVLATLVDRPDEWAFRIPFALQWVWPAVLIPLLSFAPESPWHLVRVGRIDDAERSLRRLAGGPFARRDKVAVAKVDADVKATLATIVHTDALERELTSGTSYMDCVRGVERRRTEIACVVFAGQTLCGLPFAYNSTYFFQQVGLSTDATYQLATVGTAIALLTTVVNLVAVLPYVGRRTTYMAGLLAMGSVLTAIGVLALFAEAHPAFRWTQALLTLVWTVAFQLSVGQLGWAIPPEVGSTRLRQKTVSLARASYYIAAFTASCAQPFLMNPGQLDLKGYVGFIWAASCFAVLVWAWFRLPETKDRTYEELDWLFARRTPTRKFASAKVDVFDDEARHRLTASTAEGEGFDGEMTSFLGQRAHDDDDEESGDDDEGPRK